MLYWSTNQTDITFEVHVKTVVGWFSFGTSPSRGQFTRADLVVGWINEDQQTGHFSHRQTKWDGEYAQLVQNRDQNAVWLPLYMTKTSTHSVFKFSRKLFLCDTQNIHGKNHLNISSHRINVIYTLSHKRVNNLSDDFLDVLSLASGSGIQRGSSVVDFFESSALPDQEYVTNRFTFES